MDLVNIALQVVAGLFLLSLAFWVARVAFAMAAVVWHHTIHQSRWKPKVGDECYFTNISGGRTVMQIREIDEARPDKLHCYYNSGCASWNRWYAQKDVMRV